MQTEICLSHYDQRWCVLFMVFVVLLKQPDAGFELKLDAEILLLVDA